VYQAWELEAGQGSRKSTSATESSQHPGDCLCAAGAITLSALEGKSGRDSPQTLVTCIVRADWGGWLSSKSTMYALGQVRLLCIAVVVQP
jgi:hypothetical protein